MNAFQPPPANSLIALRTIPQQQSISQPITSMAPLYHSTSNPNQQRRSESHENQMLTVPVVLLPTIGSNVAGPSNAPRSTNRVMRPPPSIYSTARISNPFDFQPRTRHDSNLYVNSRQGVRRTTVQAINARRHASESVTHQSSHYPSQTTHHGQ